MHVSVLNLENAASNTQNRSKFQFNIIFVHHIHFIRQQQQQQQQKTPPYEYGNIKNNDLYFNTSSAASIKRAFLFTSKNILFYCIWNRRFVRRIESHESNFMVNKFFVWFYFLSITHSSNPNTLTKKKKKKMYWQFDITEQIFQK